ncbi:hypothetical protein CCH79_00018706, partial [Gambusia affinis]
MPSFCAIVGCGNRGQRDVKSFFRLPAVITNQGEKTESLSRQRRCLWLSRLARDNLRDSTLPYIRVCSDHFVSGRPSALYDDANPDWAPSINLGCDWMDEGTTPTGGTQRCKRKQVGQLGVSVNDGFKVTLVEDPVDVARCSFEFKVVHGFQLIRPGLQVPVGANWPQTLWGHTQEESMEVGEPAQAGPYLFVLNADFWCIDAKCRFSSFGSGSGNAEQTRTRRPERIMRYGVLFHLLLLLPVCSAYTYQNVALRGKATQSSQFKGEPWNAFVSASNAIDGNLNSDLKKGSCTHTETENNPWWRVDLLDSYVVTQVVITNRGDCCGERLNGAAVHIGNSLQKDGTANPLVDTISTAAAGSSYSIKFSKHVEGRYVTIIAPGVNRVLHICEVEVYGYRAPTEENVAVYGKASQSTVYPGAIAYYAIDGNRASLWSKSSC